MTEDLDLELDSEIGKIFDDYFTDSMYGFLVNQYTSIIVAEETKND